MKVKEQIHTFREHPLPCSDQVARMDELLINDALSMAVTIFAFLTIHSIVVPVYQSG